MMRYRVLISVGGLALLSCAAMAAQLSFDDQIRLTPAEIARLPSVLPGAGTSGLSEIRMSVLYGNPEQSGPYTIALDVPPYTRIKAHTHKDTRTAVVVRGTWNFGYGSHAYETEFKTLGSGSYYSEPAGMAHFARTGPDGATVYISGWGPTDTHYVE